MLYALDLSQYSRAGEYDEDGGSDVSSEEGEELKDTIDEQLTANQAKFAQDFPDRQLAGNLKIVRSHKDLYASSMTYQHIKPQWYMPGGNLRDSTMADFITLCESRRDEDHMVSERVWHKVLADPQIALMLSEFSAANDNEEGLRRWFTDTLVEIQHHFGTGTRHEQASVFLGLGGAIAYTDSSRTVDDKAAYLSLADSVMFHKNEAFAGIEFKCKNPPRDKAWVKVQSSALPQTLCAIAGRLSCSVGLFLRESGFRVIWRELDDSKVGEGDVPIFKYYTYPPLRPSSAWYHLQLCHSSITRDTDGRMDLLRVMYEVARTSFVQSSVPPLSVTTTPAQPSTDGVRGETPLSAPSSPTSDVSCSSEKENVYTATSYDFGVMDSSGAVEYYTGISFAPLLSESTDFAF